MNISIPAATAANKLKKKRKGGVNRNKRWIVDAFSPSIPSQCKAALLQAKDGHRALHDGTVKGRIPQCTGKERARPQSLRAHVADRHIRGRLSRGGP